MMEHRRTQQHLPKQLCAITQLETTLFSTVLQHSDSESFPFNKKAWMAIDKICESFPHLEKFVLSFETYHEMEEFLRRDGGYAESMEYLVQTDKLWLGWDMLRDDYSPDFSPGYGSNYKTNAYSQLLLDSRFRFPGSGFETDPTL